MTPVMEAAVNAKAILARVEKRLTAGGAMVELEQFKGLSADEIDCLLRLERGLGPARCHDLLAISRQGFMFVALCSCGERLPAVSHEWAATKLHRAHCHEMDA